MISSNDQSKGAVEQDGNETARNRPPTQNSLAGQLGHRDQDEMLKDHDSDFPEPGAREEHTGE